MQNVGSIEVKRLDIVRLIEVLDVILSQVKGSSTYEDLKIGLREFDNTINEFAAQYQLAQFRFYGDTSQNEIKKLFEFYAQAYPELELRIAQFQKIVGESPFLSLIQNDYGDNVYFLCKNATFTYTEKAKQLLQEESKLTNEFVTYKSQSKVEWEGTEVAISKLYSYTKDADRQKRKLAFDTLAGYFTSNKTYFYTQLIQLIEIRNEFARELGFDSYVEYSLIKWNRIGYTYSDLKEYRDAAAMHFKETYEILFEFKKKNLNQEDITYYDNNYFRDNFPQLTDKNEKSTIHKFKTILSQLSPNWLAVYESMLEANSIDYMDRENKVNMGYATYVSQIDTPLIYSQFQNNDTDVRILTHEFGHALQFVLSYYNNPKKYFIEGTLDTVEIFSHSMEMLCLKDAQIFFGTDADKYGLLNYSGQLTQAMTCALGDEFQEIIYKQENLTIDSIQSVYKGLQEKYTGNYFDSSENDFYINGDRWMELDHYFNSPFYLIDYSLAIINALNIYKIYTQNPQRGIEIWERLAKNIAHLNYKNITNLASELQSPFDETYVKTTAEFAKNELRRLLESYLAGQTAS